MENGEFAGDSSNCRWFKPGPRHHTRARAGRNVTSTGRGDIIKLLVGKSVKKDVLTYMTGIDVKTAFTEESENIVKVMETEIKELKQALIRVQQDANAYKKESEVLTERVTELEARLRQHGEMLDVIPTMRRQIAYLKGRIVKQKPKEREKLEIIR